MRAILTYHSIDASGSVISVDEPTFAAHVRFLSRSDIAVLSLAELLSAPDDGDAVALTFDDGFANFATAAWPPLRDAGMTATVYVVGKHAGGTNRWGGRSDPRVPDLPLMGWDVLARMAEEGVELGGHGQTHCRLDGLSPDALEEEVAGSSAQIRAETGVVPRTFAYPYGAHDADAIAAAGRHFDSACTTEYGALDGSERRLELPRLDAFYLRRPRVLERFGSPGFGRSVRRRAVLRRLRATARRLTPGGSIR